MDPGNFQNLIEQAYADPKGKPKALPLRKGFYNNPQGGARDTTVSVNQYRVLSFYDGPIYQYDIKCICTKARDSQEKLKNKESTRGDLQFLWKSAEVTKFRHSISTCWVWDGNRIAWSTKGPADANEEYQVRLNVDKMNGREYKEGEPFLEKTMTFKLTTVIPMKAVKDYLSGKDLDFNNTLYQCINVFDHIFRQTPTSHHVEVKRSWFPANSERMALGLTGEIDAHKGTYCSVRLCHAPGADNPLRTGLAVNVDVSNAVFYAAYKDIVQNAMHSWAASNNHAIINMKAWSQALLPELKRKQQTNERLHDDEGNQLYNPSQAWKDLRKFQSCQILVDHNNRPEHLKNQILTIINFTFYKYGPDKSPISGGATKIITGDHGAEGANAKNTRFLLKTAGQPDQKVSVYDYYKNKYKHEVQYWWLPLIETRKGGLIPMEFCRLKPQQRYRFKLNPAQTADMIKFAVERPDKRLNAIRGGVKLLDWQNDPILKQTGIKVDPNPVVTKAKILAPPAVQFGLGGKESIKKPGTSGQWQMRDTQLFKMGRKLDNWVVWILDGCLKDAQWDSFIGTFNREYKALGYNGTVPKPKLVHANSNSLEDAVRDYMRVFNNAQYIQYFPPIIMFVCKDKNSHVYERIKHICDTKFCVMTQVVQSLQCVKNQSKYVSNVILKMNAKLGGVTARAIRERMAAPVMKNGRRAHQEPDYYRKPGPRQGSPINNLVMMIGADVSHPGALSTATSFAAITMSMDQDCCKYAAVIESNWKKPEAAGKDKEQKQGTEILQEAVFKKMGPMVDHWQRLHALGPDVRVPGTIYYLRDGVSEGQYQHVLQEEVPELRKMLVARHAKFAQSKICVIVASKRHHIRFLPGPNDTCRQAKDGNPVPGLLVERDCTHPFQNDFYLVAHRALIGCARPIHYHVLRDDLDHQPHELHELLYAHSYQYMRSTTPVSLHPAIYYAHLASKRGTAHEDFDFEHKVRTGGEAHQTMLRANTAKSVATDVNKMAAQQGKGPVLKAEHEDLPGGAYRQGVLQPKKVMELGYHWKDPRCPHREKYREIYRDFAYGMWFI